MQVTALSAGLVLATSCGHRKYGDPPTCGPCCHGGADCGPERGLERAPDEVLQEQREAEFKAASEADPADSEDDTNSTEDAPAETGEAEAEEPAETGDAQQPAETGAAPGAGE